MLSILIPTYNYNTYPLVKELHKQCSKISNFKYEIIVNDDASKNIFNNESINKLPNCFFHVQTKNQGLSASRNYLIEKATNKWCLFLDDDVWPTTDEFIFNYFNEIRNQKKPFIVFGGLEYTKKKPKTDELLRWVYGVKHEALTCKMRLKNKPNHFMCSNFLAEKSIIQQINFPEEINTYGYEDLIFNLKVIESNFPVFQIDNPVFHEKLDTSEVFLIKTRKALDNLSKSIHLNLLTEEATGISRIYKRFRKKWMIQSISFLFSINRKWMEKLLISKHTNLIIFNFYRLGYFFSIHK